MAAFHPTEDFEGSKFHVRSQTFIFTGTTARRGTAAEWSNKEGEYGSGLDLEKLKIGSPMKQNVGPVENSHLMLCDRDNPTRPTSPPRNIECRPLWKDYISVEKSFPSGHSHCGNPNASYTSLPLGSPAGFSGFKPNYRSSSIASIFGSHRSLLSPPKLDITNWGNQQRQDGDNCSMYGSGAYPSHSSNGSGFLENGSTYHICRPVSRASSQSSGFVSQHGYYTPPPSLQDFRLAPSVTASLRNRNRNNMDSGASVQSKMSWYSSANAAENGLDHGVYPNPFGTMCSQTRSSSYDTCSRFARSGDERNRSFETNQQKSRSRRSISSDITDDDEVDDDSASFLTARTSATVLRKPVFGRVTSEGRHDEMKQRNGENGNTGTVLRNLRSSEFGENQTSAASVWSRVWRFIWIVARNMLLLVGVIIMLMLLGMIFTDLSGVKVNEYIRYLISYARVFYTNSEKFLMKEYYHLLTHCELEFSRFKEKVMEFILANAVEGKQQNVV